MDTPSVQTYGSIQKALLHAYHSGRRWQHVFKNPTDYWKFWKRHRRNCQHTNHIDLQTFTKYYTENSVPPHDGNFDYGFMHKLSDFIEKCDAEIPLCHNAFIDEVMNAPMTLPELKQAIGRAKKGNLVVLTGYRSNSSNTAQERYIMPY